MVLGKIKDIVKNRREQNDEKQSVNLGFKTVSEYHKFKQDVKNDVRKKIRTKTQKQKREQLKKKIIQREEEFYGKSPLDNMVSFYGKVGTGIEKFGKVMDQIDDAMIQLDDSLNTSHKKSNKKSSRKKKNNNTFGSEFNF